jgi:xanthine/CO dehydrogenase XdhC/CoxF family maturation factor
VRDLEDILRLAQSGSGDRAALATIVRTHGSSYRAVGTRMLVMRDGSSAGALSAGCLEEDVRERGSNVIATGRAMLVPYDTRRLFGCDGRIDVLIERVETDGAWAQFLAACFEKRRRGVLLTVFEGQSLDDLGTSPLFPEDFGSAQADGEFRLRFTAEAATALASGQSVVVEQDGAGALLHAVEPPVHLVVAGGAYDAAPLATLASTLGWRVTVLARPEDDRSAFAGMEILPVIAPDEWPLSADERTAAVVMTHHFGRDAAFLRQMLQLPFGYLGLLGPRRRRDRLLQAIDTEFHSVAAPALTRLHNPAGLDLGAETPQEIALAIVAEIQAVMAGSAGGFLRARKGPIHRRSDAVALTASP